MLMKLLKYAALPLSVVLAAVTFQAPAQADNLSIDFYFQKPVHHKKHHFKNHGNGHRYGHHAPHHYQKKKHDHGVLDNRQLRHQLRSQGLYKIRILDRHRGIAKVIAHNRRGYIARYRVDTRSGDIIRGRVIRYFDETHYQNNRHHARFRFN